MKAKSALSTDVNVLADVAGTEDSPARDFKVQLRGPLSLAAGLHLHNGERALIDYGARRDIAESLAAGVGDFLSRVGTAVPGARLVVQIDEPDIAAVLAGTIPTSSGYRTLRSVPGQEVTESWRLVIDAIRAAGAVETVIAVPEIEAPFERILSSGADGIAVPLKALTSRQWEELAGAVEAGKSLWAGVLHGERRVSCPAACPGSSGERVAALAPAGTSRLRARLHPRDAVRGAGGAHAVVRHRRPGPTDPGGGRAQPAGTRLNAALPPVRPIVEKWWRILTAAISRRMPAA